MSVLDDVAVREMVATLLGRCRAKGWHLATAESLTAGLLAATITQVPGASDVVDRGFITYSYDAKAQMLGVPRELLGREGAVHEDVARAMAVGALREGHVQLTVAVTGVAGPGPSDRRPAGRVHIAAARDDGAVRHVQRDYGAVGREAVRDATVRDAVALLLTLTE